MSAPADSATRIGDFADLPAEEPFPGVRREVLGTSQTTVTRYTFEPGASFPLHRHPQEQTTLVIEGSVEMTIAGEPTVLHAGGWSVVASEVEHGITAAGEGAQVVAIIAPPRASSDDYEVTS
jgi:quercetin dioxygenase-like cupin family protein